MHIGEIMKRLFIVVLGLLTFVAFDAHTAVVCVGTDAQCIRRSADSNPLTRTDNDGRIHLPETTTPSTPDSGTGAIYFKTDGNLYIKDDDGIETDLTIGGGTNDIIGTYTFISSIVFSGADDLTFTNLVASTTYKVNFLISNSAQSFLAVQFNGDTSNNYDTGGEYLKGGPISNLWGLNNKAACTISADNQKALAGGDWIGEVEFQHWGQHSVISLRGDLLEVKDDVGLMRRYDMGCRQDSLSTLSSIKFFPADDHTTPDLTGTISGEASLWKFNR